MVQFLGSTIISALKEKVESLGRAGEEKLTGSDLAIEAAKDAVNYMATFYTIAGSIVAALVAVITTFGITFYRRVTKGIEKNYSVLGTKIENAEKTRSLNVWARLCRDAIHLYDAMHLATDKGAKATPTFRENMGNILIGVHNAAVTGASAAIQPEDNYWIGVFLLYRANALKRSGSFMPALQLAEEALRLPEIPDAMLGAAYFSAGCYASLSDNTDLCFTYLAMALSKNPKLLRDVETDDDLDKIRSDPRYAALGIPTITRC